MRLPRALVLSFGLGALALSPPAFAAPEPAAEAARAESAFAAALKEHAAWCDGKRLFGKRDETYEVLLRVDPDHAAARKALRYAREPSGAWRQGEYKRPVNWDRSLFPEHEKRLAALLATYRAHVLEVCTGSDDPQALPAILAVLERALVVLPGEPAFLTATREAQLKRWEHLDDPSTERQRDALEDRLRAEYPSDPVVRERLGDVKHGERWVLPEVVAAAARRTALRRSADQALEQAKESEQVDLSPTERAVEPALQGAYRSEYHRVCGTVDELELMRIARACDAARPLWKALFGRSTPELSRRVLFVLQGQEQRDRFLATHPLGAAALARLKSAIDRLASAYLTGGTVVSWGHPDAERRLDSHVHMHAASLLHKAFFHEPDTMKAWVYDGLGLYLTWQLLGTRRSFTVSDRYGAGFGGFKDLESGDWLTAAVRLSESKKAPPLRLALGKALDAFEADDLLVSWAFSAFLVEAHAQQTPRLLEALGSGKNLDDAFLAVFQRTPEGLERRMWRWAAETLTGR